VIYIVESLSISGGGLSAVTWGFFLYLLTVVCCMQKDGSAAAAEGKGKEKECEGANDEDECMMRRTLAAHTDYIYTQQHHG
jgi:hypothetical protein